jgi:cystathionine beta-lyase family protein involved in aluminum resistance
LIEALLERFEIAPPVARAARSAAARIAAAPDVRRANVDSVYANVLAAFVAEGIAEHDLAGSYGYGYDDPARASSDS